MCVCLSEFLWGFYSSIGGVVDRKGCVPTPVCPLTATLLAYVAQCVNNAGNILYQLGNIALLGSLVFEDLLFIRVFLGLGFSLLLAWALLGLPIWGGPWLGIGISVRIGARR